MPLKIVVAALLAAGLLAVAPCVPPESFRQVKQPRPGRALNDHVAVVYSKHYQINLAGFERLHSFDINKYARIYLALNTEGLLIPEDVFVPEAVTDQQVLLVHTPGFLESLKDSSQVARYLEAPLAAIAPAALIDAGILQAFRYATGGTIRAAQLALKYGIAINLAGGYHHATPQAGGGFNIYADMAIAIRHLQGTGRIARALVVDLDVHQGNGTAVCFAGDESVFTFSMHQRDIYPIPKETSDLDIELPAGADDRQYLLLLQSNLPAILDLARPDIVFLQAGCDVLADDPLASLALTPAGVVRRDAMVIDECVGRSLPVVMVLGGGYSEKAWQVQFASIRRTIETYGQAPGGEAQRRQPTVMERLYTK